MIFLDGFLWGAGISLGFCVGLVAWLFLKTATYWVLGVTEELKEDREFSAVTVRALLERNRLTKDTIDRLERIANAIALKR